MKQLFTLFLICVFTIHASAQNAITVIKGNDSDAFYAMGMSSDGKYITGQVGSMNHMFVWKDGEGVIESDINKLLPNQQGSNSRGVSLTGRVAGICPNPEHQYVGGANDDPSLKNSNVPTASLFDYEKQKWIFLPVKSSTPLVTDYGSRAYAISDSGSLVVGAQNPGGATIRWIAGYWNETETGTFAYTALRRDVSPSRGSLAKTVSGDGSVIGGFKAEIYNWNPTPVLWIDLEKTGSYVETRIPGVTTGCIESVSNNGKYAVLSFIIDDQSYACLYEIEEQRLVEIDSKISAALAVSDNGVTVGHWGGLYYGTQISTYSTSYNGRHIDDAKNGGGAFIFTEKMGTKALKQFFDEKGITYPAGFNFKAATAISKDGRIICGYGVLNGQYVSFRADIPEITDVGIFPARKLRIESPAYGAIRLSWDSVPAHPAFQGYKVFRVNGTNATLLATVQENFYELTGLADGTYSYYVVSSYAEKDADKTKTQTITIGKREFPVFESFKYKSTEELKSVYWDISHNTMADSWLLDPLSGIPPGCIKFLNPLGGYYSESLTSPYLDATGLDSIRLSFSIGIPGSDIEGSENEKLAVEVFADGIWHLVEEIPATGRYGVWFSKSYDISRWVANKNEIRVRFRCYGESAGGNLNWFVDNIEIADKSNWFVPEDPMVVSARYVEEDNVVHVNWSDPQGFVSLRYTIWDTPEDVVSSIGNNGIPFIAANMYPAEDLSGYEGYQLTSLSFMRGTNPDKTALAEPKFKWFVSQGGERLFSGDVKSPEMGVWTTIELTKPLTIDVTKPLYYGVEVTEYDPDDWPFAVGYIWKEEIDEGSAVNSFGVPVADGRGNIFSTDGGNIWKKISDESDGNDIDIFFLRATLAQDPKRQRGDRLKGYMVMRDNINLLGQDVITALNNYTDTIPLTENNSCYTIQAYYIDQSASKGLQSCLSLNGLQLIEKENNLKIYPNPVKKGETVMIEMNKGEIATLRIYNLSGRMVKALKIHEQMPIRIDLDRGVYLLKIKNREPVKLIVN